MFFLPSESQAEADVGERVRGIFIQTPADSDAEFKVWRDQIVNSRAEVLRRHILRSIVSKNAKILSVHIPAFGNWHLEHDGRRPLIEVIAFLLSGHIAKRGIELAFLQNLPAEYVSQLKRGCGFRTGSGSSPLENTCTFRNPAGLICDLCLDALEHLRFFAGTGFFQKSTWGIT